MAIHRARARHAADILAIAAALALPWSTSISSVLIAILVVALLVSLDGETVRRTPLTLAGIMPLALWAVAAIGMLWADVPWPERLVGMRAFHKLLIMPLLLVHFSRSNRGWLVAGAYLVSCSMVLPVSFLFAARPELAWHWVIVPGVPVRDRIAQSGEFVLCALALVALALPLFRQGRVVAATAMCVLAGLFLVNIIYVVNSRTSLVVGPILAVVVGARWVGWKGVAAVVGILVLIGTAGWSSSSYLRDHVEEIGRGIQLFLTEADRTPVDVTSTGERLEYWTKSISFIRTAPIIGHGTGSMPDLFRRSTAGKTGLGAIAAENPHNQTLAVAIDLGLVGVLVLWTMWIVHLLLLTGPSLAGTFGLLVVVQNIVSSLFNLHLADFAQGWTYVLGVGVFGGMLLGQRWREQAPRHEPRPVLTTGG
jgi:hypothetical protein